LIYFPTCAMVDYFHTIISNYILSCGSIRPVFHIHRKMDQKKRQGAYSKFRAAVSNTGPIMLCTDLAARGLDIPDIDCIIQFDPPQDPKAFIHHCGRTGRMGKSGTAIVYLDSNEDAYVNFLLVRKVPMIKYEEKFKAFDDDTLTSRLCEYIRTRNSKQKEWYERGMKAFVSYLRFYQEHQAKFIFQFKKLDMVGLIHLFGLVQVPKMKELKPYEKQISDQFVSINLEFDSRKNNNNNKQKT